MFNKDGWKFITNFHIKDISTYQKACDEFNILNPNSVSIGRSSFGQSDYTKGLWRNQAKNLNGFWVIFDRIKQDESH